MDTIPQVDVLPVQQDLILALELCVVLGKQAQQHVCCVRLEHMHLPLKRLHATHVQLEHTTMWDPLVLPFNALLAQQAHMQPYQ